MLAAYGSKTRNTFSFTEAPLGLHFQALGGTVKKGGQELKESIGRCEL